MEEHKHIRACKEDIERSKKLDDFINNFTKNNEFSNISLSVGNYFEINVVYYSPTSREKEKEIEELLCKHFFRSFGYELQKGSPDYVKFGDDTHWKNERYVYTYYT